MAGSMVEWNSRHPQIRRFDHGYTPSHSCVRHHRPNSKIRCRMPQTGRLRLISRLGGNRQPTTSDFVRRLCCEPDHFQAFLETVADAQGIRCLAGPSDSTRSGGELFRLLVPPKGAGHLARPFLAPTQTGIVEFRNRAGQNSNDLGIMCPGNPGLSLWPARDSEKRPK